MKSEERESWPAGQSERILSTLGRCSLCAMSSALLSLRLCLSCPPALSQLSRLRLVPCAFIPLSDKGSASLGRHYQTNQADTVTHNQDTIKGRGLSWSGVTGCEVATASSESESDSGVKNCEHLQLNTPPHEHSRTHTHSYMQAHTQTHNTLAHTHAS